MRERVIGPPEGHGPHSDLCIANGCPMIGTLAFGGADRKCWLHDTAPAKDWPVVTEAMRRHDALLRLYSKAINASPGDPVPEATRDWLRSHDYADVAALPAATARQFGYAIRTWLSATCIPKIDRADRQRRNPPGPVPIQDLLP